MSIAGRALEITTGHPYLKLVLLTVAAAPGWPAAADVAVAAEVPLDLAEDALAELVRRGHVTAHTAADATRYSLPDDGWNYTRADTVGGTPAEAPQERSLKALESGDIGGYAWTARGTSA